MPTSRFPCRVCGESTEGVDTYVVCADCAADFDVWADENDRRSWAAGTAGAPTNVPLSPDEVEARLRRLLDDW